MSNIASLREACLPRLADLYGMPELWVRYVLTPGLSDAEVVYLTHYTRSLLAYYDCPSILMLGVYTPVPFL